MRADAARNRARILAATRDLLIEYGPDVPADHIMARSGTTSGTFYRRFPDRGDLMRAVVVDEAESTLAQLARAREAIEDDGDWETWRAAVVRLLDTHGQLMPPFIVALSGQLADDAEATGAYERVHRAVHEIIRVAQDRGLVRPDVDPADVTLYLLTAVRPLPHLPSDQHARVRVALIETILRGLRP